MAQREVVTLTDDIDGSEADRTVRFGLDGATYEIDLSSRNAVALTRALGRFVAAGRKVRGVSSQTGSRPTRVRSRTDLADIRGWAKQNGIDVSERGRVAQKVQDAYDAAH